MTLVCQVRKLSFQLKSSKLILCIGLTAEKAERVQTWKSFWPPKYNAEEAKGLEESQPWLTWNLDAANSSDHLREHLRE